MLWLDGELHEASRATFDLRDRGLLLADGVFDTMLVIAGTPVFGEFHLDRLMAAAELLRLDVERQTAERAVAELAKAADGHAVVRVTVTRGAGVRGLRISAGGRATVFALLSPWKPDMAFAPVALATSTIRRNASSPLSRVKSLAYLDNVLALDEAAGQGADDALILSTSGNVACTSAGNLFVLRGSELATPPLSEGVLNGTIREILLSHAAEKGFDPVEASLRPDDLVGADALFLTNSVRLVSPVTALDGRPLPDARPRIAPLVDLIRNEIERGCGVNPWESRRAP